MRYSYVAVLGRCRIEIDGVAPKVKGFVLHDSDTHYEFFMSADTRLRDTGWVFGGIPIALVPDEDAWNDVCRYTLGVNGVPKGAAAIAECGCPMLKLFDWEQEGERAECNGGHDRAWLTQLLQDTTAVGNAITTFDPLMNGRDLTNTDYECATRVFPFRRGSVAAPTMRGDEEDEMRATPADIPSSIIAAEYTTDNDYVGYAGYHAHHGHEPNHPINPSGDYMIGVELEVECHSSADKRRLNNIHSNWFYQERDGSLSDRGTEIITIPLRVKDARNVEFWKPMTAVVSKLADSWRCSSTGLHVHISRTILGDTAQKSSETLGKLLYFWHHIVLDGGAAEKKNAEIYGRSHCYHQMNGKTESGKAAKALGVIALKHKDVAKAVADSMMAQTARERYYDINTTNPATIEFRKGKGSINPERIVNIVTWSELMVLYCKVTKWENLSFDGFRSYVRDSKIAPESLKAKV